MFLCRVAWCIMLGGGGWRPKTTPKTPNVGRAAHRDAIGERGSVNMSATLMRPKGRRRRGPDARQMKTIARYQDVAQFYDL